MITRPPFDLSPGVDGYRLLDALALQETNGGKNNCPRFEPSYMPEGSVFTIQGRIVRGTGVNFNSIVKKRWDLYDLASSASYSKWQILYHTAADLGFNGSPWELWENSLASVYVTDRLKQIAKGPATETVEQFADAWNSGNYRDKFEPKEYMREVRAHYDALAVKP